jgi:hypothetical protein
MVSEVDSAFYKIGEGNFLLESAQADPDVEEGLALFYRMTGDANKLLLTTGILRSLLCDYCICIFYLIYFSCVGDQARGDL